MADETRTKTNSDEEDLDELLNSITNELNKTRHVCEKHANYKAPCLLYRINPQSRLLDPHSYNPCVVSIGPYHHGYMKLNAMERDKLKCVRFVIEYNSERRLSDCLSAVREVSEQARCYYHEEILMESQDFEKMLLLDGCFLLVSLYGITGVPDQSTAENHNLESYLTNPERQRDRWHANFANRDILLTENQIPFFVIEKIYEVLAGRVAIQALTKEIAKYMERVLHIFPKAIQESNRPNDFHHLLHLCHMYFKPSESFGEMYSYVTRSDDRDAESLLNRQPMKWRRAIEYHEAGIEFKLKVYNKHKPHSLLDIEFRRGVIEIPYFLVDDSTVPLFKNLVAFEQSSLQFDNDVAAFIFFISELVRDSDDVKLLTQCGIISHPMHGERDVATIFSRLSKGVVFDVDGNYYLKSQEAVSLDGNTLSTTSYSEKTLVVAVRFEEQLNAMFSCDNYGDHSAFHNFQGNSFDHNIFKATTCMADEGRNKTNSDEEDLDELLNSITNELNNTRSLCEKHANNMPPCLIYRISPLFRQLDRHSYNPCVLSIGPYHHGSTKLNAMESDKLKCVRFVIEYNRERKLSDYLGAIREVVELARSYYPEKIMMETEDFEKMLFFDGCFLLVSLYGITGVHDPSIEEQINSESYLINPERQVDRWCASYANRDILLMENQIPFFVVEKIYEVLAGRTDVHKLREEIAKYIEGILHGFPKAIQESNRPREFHHVLHLCHMYFKPSKSFGDIYSFMARSNNHDEESQLNQQPMKWRRAIEYHKAGIEFKPKVFDRQKAHSLLDVEIRRGVIEIPYFPVDDGTTPLFKNLVAFEQSSPQFGNNVTAFIILISELIQGSDDVKLFSQCGIISHPVHSDREVANIFSRLSKGVVFDVDGDNYLKRLCHLMETHFQRQATPKKHWWWRYGSKNNSIRCLVAITMVIIVLFTIFRAIVSIITYLKPPPVIIITRN